MASMNLERGAFIAVALTTYDFVYVVGGFG